MPPKYDYEVMKGPYVVVSPFQKAFKTNLRESCGSYRTIYMPNDFFRYLAQNKNAFKSIKSSLFGD